MICTAFPRLVAGRHVVTYCGSAYLPRITSLSAAKSGFRRGCPYVGRVITSILMSVVDPKTMFEQIEIMAIA